MLEAAERSGVEVVGGAASLVASDPDISASDVVLVADEESLEDAGISLPGDDSPAILVLSEDERVVPKLRALLPRGWGILPPDASPEELEAAVIAVARGLVVIPETMTGRLLGTHGEAEPPEPLTNREGEVLGLIGRGLSNRMISRELHISEHTVKFHISSLYAKLGVGNRAEAVSRGARYGLISL
jgi:DNA-binding NarL/FixJ family response regulator